MDQATRALLGVARGVLDDLDVEVVLERVLESARELTGARYGALGVLDRSRTELSRFLTSGIDEATQRRIGRLPSGRGVLGELISTPEPLRLADVSAHPRSYGFPVGHPPMKSFIGVPIIVAGEPFGNIYLTDKRSAEQFSEADLEAVVQLADFAGVAIDHARRYTGSESRRTELEQTVDALEATIQIARALGGQTDLETILELVAKRGRALVGARALVIELERDGELVVAAGAGAVPAGLIGQRVNLADTVASTALRTRRSQRLGEELNRARFEQHGLGQFGLHAQDGLVVPLVFRNRSYGVLVAVDRIDGGSEFTAKHQRLLEAFGASAATAVATARSAADERRHQTMAAAEAERGRWARELHDETLQGMANLRLVLAAAQRVGTKDALSGAFDDVIEQLETDIANLRRLITDLRPAALDQLGTEAAIRALADRVIRETQLELELELSIDLAYEQGRATERHIPELETAVYRIVQEALTNATKHGRAQRVAMELIEDDTRLRVTVRDDGVGFELGNQTDGFGLLGMRERAELLEGKLRVTSSPGRGTCVQVTFPARRQSNGLPAEFSSGSIRAGGT
ncbi:MAG: sensor histidine kinase [Solirubrobacteraceae bacterium]